MNPYAGYSVIKFLLYTGGRGTFGLMASLLELYFNLRFLTPCKGFKGFCCVEKFFLWRLSGFICFCVGGVSTVYSFVS